MRVVMSWLRDYVDLPPAMTAEQLGAAFTRLGFEVEQIESPGADVTGPVVIGRVLDIEELTGFNKPIRSCRVEVGQAAPRGIVCGATNLAVGDLVVVSLPGAVLPGGFAIAARPTYGHLSDGMICSPRELGLGEDHAGIMVLPGSPTPGEDAIEVLHLRDEVIDLDVTPDRGYAESMRGIAREASHALDLPAHDPADLTVLAADDAGWPARIDDATGCDRISLRTVTGLDPAMPTPLWMRSRLIHAGMRPISLAVDVTNYVMLEIGQPMHAYDRSRLAGGIGVRRARSGERLTTLEGIDRQLDPDDMVVSDDSGPIGLGGVMGGASTEISAATVDVVLEAAHWDPPSIARAVRRHRLPSEAARRFEHGVDPQVAGPALARAAALLAEHGGATAVTGYTVVGEPPAPQPIRLELDLPGRISGAGYPAEVVIRRLEQVGCTVRVDGAEGADGADGAGDVDRAECDVTPPSWRPDLLAPADLVEEVARLEGYDAIPSILPTVPPGHGRTVVQRRRSRVAVALADSGLVEVVSYPFMSTGSLTTLGFQPADPASRAVRLRNPLANTEPLMRTSLLPGLFTALRRNVGRGLRDVAVFEIGCAYLQRADQPVTPAVPVGKRPTPAQIAALDAALPDQPWHAAAVLAGGRDPRGWWGTGRPADWSDAVAAAQVAAGAMGAQVIPRAAAYGPWHPGRCAQLRVGARVVGHAGELHPRVISAMDLPARTCAMELDLDAIGYADSPADPPAVSAYPPVLLDVALVVAADTSAADVDSALRDGAGELLESSRLFDVYAGDQLGAGRKSLAYTLRLRAPDRTLTAEQATGTRDAAVAEAARRTGAALRT
ncbi:MAG: phenylalanine--tRNA ligase subunit beta [Mycobacteriales bacterium]